MAVRIEEVSVENLGPISEFSFKLGSLNLIYGRNEVGKTFLVEFLLQSLFSDLSDWNFRSSSGRGQVVVSGLNDKPIPFTPTSREKLESYLSQNSPGLPPKLSRLLVVKGAELGLDNRVHGGVNQHILKAYLSGQSTLDTIEDKIPATVRKAKIVDGSIQGANKGDISRQRERFSEIKGIDMLFEELDVSYSGARRKELLASQQTLTEEKLKLVQAKRHLAYQLDARKQELDVEVAKYPEATLREIDDDLRNYVLVKNKVAVKEKELDGLKKDSDDFLWLESASVEYEKRIAVTEINVNPIFLIMTIIFLAVALITGLYGMAIVPGVFVLVAMISGGLYIRQLRNQTLNTSALREVNRFEESYKERFNEPLSDLSEMLMRKKLLEKNHYRAQTLSEQLLEERREMDTYSLNISENLQHITSEEIDPSEWQKILSTMTDEHGELQAKANDIDRELLSLAVEPSEYEIEPADIDFDRERLDDIEHQLLEIDQAIKAETDALDRLKQRICDRTGDDITVEWQSLIENLRTRRKTVAEKLKHLSSKVIAQICLTGVLEELREQEDEVIRQNLASPMIQAPLKLITDRYNSLFLDGDHLKVRDDFGEFEISDLSTGAREQVLLALRLGIASRVLKQDKLFLILDDAFQHSDWDRRDRLVNQAVTLAKQDWQVIYFTMDNHIRDLITEKGDRHLGENFRSKVLEDRASG